MSDRESLIAQVNEARDVLDVLSALLATCRAHPDQLAQAIQGGERRREMARRIREVRDAVPSVAVGPAEKQLLCEFLSRADNYVLDASEMRNYAGLLSFPGGSRDANGTDPVSTALREASEEIGLEPASVQILGLLAPVTDPKAYFVVVPVLG